MYFSRFLRVKHIVRRVVEAQIVGRHVFSCRSLILSTTILNEKVMMPFVAKQQTEVNICMYNGT